jgi:hypothetical protein
MKPMRLATLLAFALAALAAPPADAGKLIFEITDPRGDDHGDGRIVYPLREEFARGDLDLISLRARKEKKSTVFEATFANDIKVPERRAVDDLGTQLDTLARHGFYTFNLDLYIDMDREAGSGGVNALPGRNATLASAWDRAVILTPQPAEAKGQLRRIVVDAMSEAMRVGDENADEVRDRVKKDVPRDLDERVFFPTRVRVRGRTVSFSVPDSFLGGAPQATWGYTVAVSGADLMQSLDLTARAGLARETREALMVLEVRPGTWKDFFGGGRDEAPLQPPLIDILVPDGQRQEEILRDFDSDAGRMVELPAVVPAAAASAP